MKCPRMVVVSNRLPISIDWNDGGCAIHPSSGGLVTAVAPILQEFGGCWIGWTGAESHPSVTGLLNDWTATHNYSLHAVEIPARDQDCFYNGCSNQIIWPLFHGVPSRCRFDSAYWASYRNVSERFARAVEEVQRKGDFVWVQDYHLMLLGEHLRAGRKQNQNRIAYFHHIPFPSPDVFETLPWRTELLAAMMHYDMIGFQTNRDVKNFVSSMRRLLPDTRISHIGSNLLLKSGELSAVVGSYPISIDFDEFSAAPIPITDTSAAAVIQSAGGAKVVLGVDRLDYTKGIPQRLAAFRALLEKNESLRGRITPFQIIVPSREDIPEYQRLKLEIERTISEINGQFSIPGWIPVHYFHRAIPREELIGFYRAADIALVTPLRDGMNLVAKEFCAARTDNRGVLILSEFAGAAEELAGGALILNPNDIEAVASSISDALVMTESEQEWRMKMMRSHIRTHDVFQWAYTFTRDAIERPAAISQRAAIRVAGD